ncbi:MAG: amphi-Trp domain-containing protein [Desulfonatronovibrio sp.]
MSKNELKIKGAMEKDIVISRLEEILSAMKQGYVSIEDKEGNVTLSPGEFIEMELKVKSKKEKEKIEIELSWRSDREAAKIKPLDFEISTQINNPQEPVEAIEQKENILDNLESDEERKMTPASSAPTIVAEDGENK